MINSVAAVLKMLRYMHWQKCCQWLLESMACSSDGKAKQLSLNRVFADHLDPNKCWYALNSSLCASKPSQFCSTASALEFPEEYKLVSLADLRAKDGSQASSRWFCFSRSIGKVYVATAFGVLLGILRLRSWTTCQFFHSEQLKSIVCDLNSRGLEAGRCSVSNVAVSSLVENRKIGVRQRIGFHNMGPVKHCGNSASLPSDSPPKGSKESAPRESPPTGWESPPKMKRSISELKADQELSPPVKRRKIREQAVSVMGSIHDLCEQKGESLHTILTECCLLTGDEGLRVRDSIKAIIDAVTEEKGVRNAFSKLISDETWDKRVQTMRVPDWMYLLFKLKARISDSAWQDLTNLTKLGRTGKTSDEAIILVKNNIAALRQGVFSVTRSLMNVSSLPAEVPGFEVNLENVAVWVIREMRLHGSLPEDILFNLKIDGRPFFGKDQVTVGIVPLDAQHRSSQSAKSVYPLAIANCKEKRDDLKKLFKDINNQKDKLKKMGIRVDGKHYQICFKGIGQSEC